MSATIEGVEHGRPEDSDLVAPTLTPLADVVPVDWLRIVRLTMMGVYLFFYIRYLYLYGLPLDRISVAISLFLFLACAFVGRSIRTWAVLIVDVVLYAVMWLAYEVTRGAGDHLGFPLQVSAMRNIDKFMFFGYDPNVVLQQHFWHPAIHWWDEAADVAYYTHFIVPVVVMAVLWATSHRQWVRFMKRFATLLAIACAMFVVLPTAPPWMVSRAPYHLIPTLQRKTGRGFYQLGGRAVVKTWQDKLDWGNAVAAMPSLHASFALIVPAFFLPWIKPKPLKALVLCFPVIMLTSLVYLGEHWVIDGIVGWLIVAFSFWFWGRMEQRTRSRRAAAARFALSNL